jgi:molecular chaperone HtpG
MTMYRNNFLTNDHSYYDDTSLLMHQTFSPRDGHYSDDKFELYSVSGERFGNRVKFDWPKVELDRPYPRLEYNSGFNILGYGSVAHGTLCLICRLQEAIVLWNPSTEEFKVIPPSPFDSGPYWEAWL